MGEIDEMSALASDPIEEDALYAGSQGGQANAMQHDVNEENRQVLGTILAAGGVEDMSDIKFETNDGNIVSRNWNDLSITEKAGIAGNAAASAGRFSLSDDEVELINDMRRRGMSSEEYIGTVYNNGRRSMEKPQSYDVDEMSDDELFVLDAIARYGEDYITDEQVGSLLNNAKADKELYAKTIGMLRDEYRKKEEERQMSEKQAAEEERRIAYDEYCNDVLNEISNLNDFAGLGIELTNGDKNDLANFMLTEDAVGNTEFGKALNNPRLRTQMAFWILKGPDMLRDLEAQVQEAYRAGMSRSSGRSASVVRADRSGRNKKAGPQRMTNAGEMDVN